MKKKKLLPIAQEYLDEWQERLMLQHVRFALRVADIDEGRYAQIATHPLSHSAVITFSKNFNKMRKLSIGAYGYSKRQAIEFSIVHELVHYLEEPWATALDQQVAAVKGPRRKLLEWYTEQCSESFNHRITKLLLAAKYGLGAWSRDTLEESAEQGSQPNEQGESP